MQCKLKRLDDHDANDNNVIDTATMLRQILRSENQRFSKYDTTDFLDLISTNYKKKSIHRNTRAGVYRTLCLFVGNPLFLDADKMHLDYVY